MASITKPRSEGPERREVIDKALRSAVEALLAEGWSYTELPVQKIAQEAGIARSTFYAHYLDKAQLIIRMTEEVYDAIFAESLDWFLGNHRGGPADMAKSLRRIIALYREHSPLMRAAIEVATYEPAFRQAHRSKVGAYVSAVRERLWEAHTAGQLHPDVDVDRTADILHWMTERSIAQHILENDPSTDGPLADALARAAWLMLYGDARKPPAPVRRGP